MGRWTLTALVINSVIGSGIFGLPSVVAGYVGNWSPLAYLIAAIAVAVVMACFAEVASQFDGAGGPYLYARETFGRLLGIETAWLSWLVRATATAAAINLFTSYLAEFCPAVKEPMPRLAVLTILIGFLAVVNYRGVKSGAATSNIFTVAKLSALFFFAIAGGIFLLRAHPAIPTASTGSAPPPMRNWFAAIFFIWYAYAGFDAALIPMAEVKDPRRDAPIALFAALAVITILYCAIQYVVVAALPAAPATDRPLASAAREMWGRGGAALITAGALISLYGYLSAQMLHTPRLTFALGERGDFPPFFTRIHPTFHTPHVSILFFTGIVWSLAALGNFKWNVIISSAARLFAYAIVCAALPVLRRTRPNSPSYRLPAGNFVAALGVVFMLVLALRMGLGEWIVILATLAIAFANWLWARKITA
jgi:amino acid transporter